MLSILRRFHQEGFEVFEEAMEVCFRFRSISFFRQDLVLPFSVEGRRTTDLY